MLPKEKNVEVKETELKDRDSAIFNLKCLVEKDPENAQVHLRLGALLSESGVTHDVAIKSLRTALSLAMKTNTQENTRMRREATSRLLRLLQHGDC